MALRRTPFFSAHQAAGARMVPFAGFEMPVQYVGLKEEHKAVRQSVGLFDVSHMGEVRVRGPKAQSALQAMLSNDIEAIGVGQAQYNVMCNEKGGIVDDLVVYRLAQDDFLVCVNAGNRDKDFRWMVGHNPFPNDAVFTDVGDDWAQIAVQGRNAVAVLGSLVNIDLGEIGVYQFARGEVAGVQDCIVARTGYTGEDGFEVFAPAASSLPLWSAVMEAGESHGIVPIGLGARDTLRLEVRYCLYGHELTEETSPLQAGLGWVTKLNKVGGFVGSDALAARKGKESHRLAGLVLEGKRIARQGMRVLHDGEDVGWVTSGTRAPTVDKPICLAYVRRPLFRPGTRLCVDVRGRSAVGEVVKGSFYERDY